MLHLESHVLGLRQDAVQQGREDAEHEAEHEEGAEHLHVLLQHRVQPEGEHQEDAGEGPGEALAGGAHVGGEQLAGEDEGQGLHAQLYGADQQTDGRQGAPLEHCLQAAQGPGCGRKSSPGSWILGGVVDEVGEDREGQEAEEGEGEGYEVHGAGTRFGVTCRRRGASAIM